MSDQEDLLLKRLIEGEQIRKRAGLLPLAETTWGNVVPAAPQFLADAYQGAVNHMTGKHSGPGADGYEAIRDAFNAATVAGGAGAIAPKPIGAIGVFGGGKVMPRKLFKRDVADLVREYKRGGDYEHVGLRVTEEPLAVGQRPPSSRVWDEGNPTAEKLGGTSAVDIRSPDLLDQLGYSGKNSNKHGYYWGDNVAVIGSNSATRGADPNELVMKDGTVLGAFMKPHGTGDLRPGVGGMLSSRYDEKAKKAAGAHSNGDVKKIILDLLLAE